MSPHLLLGSLTWIKGLACERTKGNVKTRCPPPLFLLKLPAIPRVPGIQRLPLRWLLLRSVYTNWFMSCVSL